MKEFVSPQLQSIKTKSEGSYVGSGTPVIPTPGFVPAVPLTPIDTAGSDWSVNVDSWSHDGGSHSDFHVRLSFRGGENAKYDAGTRNLRMVFTVGFQIKVVQISGTRSDTYLIPDSNGFIINYNGVGRPGECVDISLWIERYGDNFSTSAGVTGDSIEPYVQTLKLVSISY